MKGKCRCALLSAFLLASNFYACLEGCEKGNVPMRLPLRQAHALVLLVALVLLSLRQFSFIIEPLQPNVAFPIAASPSSTTQATCNSAQTCLSCAALHNIGCTWCVETSKCLIDDGQVACFDKERGYCSPILLRSLPARIRVIYVGKRSGGPEALVQLHLALLFWGFNSTLETRVKQVGKGLLPYFRQSYAAEFATYGIRMHRSKDYAGFLSSGLATDLLVLTETWPCKRSLIFYGGSGARQLQYYLTAQDRRWTYDISHMYIPDAHPEACTIIGHTDFIANSYLNISRKAMIRPYVSPHIVQRAASFQQAVASGARKKKTSVLYDGDAGIDEAHFSASFRPRLRKAASLKPDALYSLMEDSVAVIDFNMPGAERLVLEAALFSCLVIINDELNGASTVDFPVPARFRIKGRNYSCVEQLVSEADSGRSLSRELEPFVTFVKQLRPDFLRQVRRYFSDSVHVVLRAQRELDSSLQVQILSVLLFVPLATISVTFTGQVQLVSGLPGFLLFRSFLEQHYLLSSVEFTSAGRETVPASAAYVVEISDREWYFASQNVVGALAVECEAGPCPYRLDRNGAFLCSSRESWLLGLRADNKSHIETVPILASWRSAGEKMLAHSVSEVAESAEARESALWKNFCDTIGCTR